MNEMIDRCRVAAIGAIQQMDIPAGTRIDSEKIVRAVIEAMREPTESMFAAAATVDRYAEPGEEWGPMIDAALGK